MSSFTQLEETPRSSGAATATAAATPDKPLRVTVEAAAEVARTAKEKHLTAEEEEQLKTRTRYRLYQRNHRAKKKRRLEELETLVAAMHEEISELEQQKQKARCPPAHHVVQAFATAVSSLSPQSSLQPSLQGDAEAAEAQQSDCLRDLVDESGSLWTAVHQWKRLCGGFFDWKLEIVNGGSGEANTTTTIDQHDVSIVSCGLVLTLEGSVDHFTKNLPALRSAGLRHVAIKLASQRQLQVPGRGMFAVAASGRIHAMSMEFDFVRVLVELLAEPLAVVASVLIGNQLDRFQLNANEASPVVAQLPKQLPRLAEIPELCSRKASSRQNKQHQLSIDFLLC